MKQLTQLLDVKALLSTSSLRSIPPFSHSPLHPSPVNDCVDSTSACTCVSTHLQLSPRHHQIMYTTVYYLLEAIVILSLLQNVVLYSQTGVDSGSNHPPSADRGHTPGPGGGTLVHSGAIVPVVLKRNGSSSIRDGFGGAGLSTIDDSGGSVGDRRGGLRGRGVRGRKTARGRREQSRVTELFAASRASQDPKTGKGLDTLPSPSQPRLEHINMSAVLISWTYPFNDVPPPIQFIVQMEKNSAAYKNVSKLQNETCYIYPGLKLNGRYRFRVIANQYDQSSNPSEPSYLFTNGETAPSGPPINVGARSLSYKSIELSWDPPDYFRGSLSLLYEIYASTDPGSLVEITDPVLGETHKTIDNLSPGTTYYFALKSDFGGHVSILSTIASATTDAAYLPPVIVTALNASTTWFWLAWSEPSPERYPLKINNFTIYYTTEDNWISIPVHFTGSVPSSFQNVTVSAESRYGNVTGLYPATVYVVQVGYMAGGYWSQMSKSWTVSTLEGVTCTYCAPLSPTVLLIRWKTSSNDTGIRTFQIFEEEGGGAQWNRIALVNSSTPTTEYNITSLHPWTGYTFLVALASSGSGDSPSDLSDQCPIEQCWTQEAAPSKPPMSIQLSPVSSSQISLSWSPVPTSAQNGIIREYIIVFECTPRGDWQDCNTRQVVVPAATTNQTFEDLVPFTEYTFLISAENLAGEGPWSLPHTATTLEEAPSGAPENLTLLNVSEHSALLTWECPLPWKQNGVITGYVLWYNCSSFNRENTLGEGEPSSTETSNQGMSVSDETPSSVLLPNGLTGPLWTINVSVTWVEISHLSPGTMYSVSVAAETAGGIGPKSKPLEFSTLKEVIYETLDLNFTAQLNTTTNQTPSDCFSITFTWTLPSTWRNSNMAVMNLSLSYNSSRNQTGVVLLGRNVTTVFVLNSSTSDLLHSSVYTFWLSLKLDFLNGTLEWLRSCPANVTTPSCSEDGSNSAEEPSYVWIIELACGCVAVAIATFCCVSACCAIRRLLRRRRRNPPDMLMDSYQARDVEEEYLSLALRRSDGQSDSSSSGSSDVALENGTPSPNDIPPPSCRQRIAESDSDSVSSNASEKSPLLQTNVGLREDSTQIERDCAEPVVSFLSERQQQLLQDWPFGLGQADIASVPRDSPEGCSESSSSSSESSYLPDV